MKATMRALLARQIDNVKADELIRLGFTLEKLKAKSVSELKTLGLQDVQIEAIHDSRHAIEDGVLVKLLVVNNSTCCRCKESKPFILHHIIPYSKSRDNSINNLCVLCLGCHGDAHTTHELSQNLTPELLREFKKDWENIVQQHRAGEIASSTRVDFSSWDFFNHSKLFALAQKYSVTISDKPNFKLLRSSGILAKDGSLNRYNRWSFQPIHYMYRDMIAMKMHDYHAAILLDVLTKQHVIPISDEFRQSYIHATMNPGDLFSLEAFFRFKNWGEQKEQMENAKCYYKRKRVKIEMIVNRWEATSNSSYSSHLRGSKNLLCIGIYRGGAAVDGVFTFDATCLALGNGFHSIKKREKNYVNERMTYEADDEADDEPDGDIDPPDGDDDSE